MKKLAVTLAPLLALFCISGGAAAYAADGGTIYPEDERFVKTLTLTSLTDYAVEDGLYAFAEGKNVKVYKDGSYLEYAFASSVSNVDISEGTIYCGCADGTSYTVTNQTECEYSFSPQRSEALFGGYLYFLDDGKNLCVFDKASKETVTYEGSYSNLKVSGDKVYASAGATLYEFSAAQRSEVVLNYNDYSVTRQITVGKAASALKVYAPVQFVEIEQGAYMTEIDLEKLDGEFFSPAKTSRAEENTVALLLCYSGNAAIVSIENTGYILLKSRTKEITVEYNTQKPFENAQMLGGMIYASPCVVSGTVTVSNATSAIVKVLNQIEYDAVLGSIFYEVEYTEGEKTVIGYVAKGFLSEYIIEDNKKPVEITDPEYSESNDTKTILIIFAVVTLVLAAIAYVSHVSAIGKRKKQKRKKDAQNDA